MTTKAATTQCPFAVYPYECDKPTCDGCSIREAAIAKSNAEIAGNMEDYWASIRSGAER